MRRCLRDPTFSRFDTIPECDRHTHRHTTTANTALSISSRGNNLKVWLKSMLPLLKYRIFSRGLFFYWRTLYVNCCVSWLLYCVLVAVQQDARVVQLVSHPFLGQDVLRAGPSQFGLNLHSHSGVSVLSECVMLRHVTNQVV